MAKLEKFHNIVFEILQEKEETREDDFLLFYEVIKRIGLGNLRLDYILTNHAILGIPSFETISRCRRKIQREHPELSGEAMRKIRKKEEMEFRAYALNHK